MKYLKFMALAMSAYLCTSCGIIKSSSNPMFNAGIKIADKAYVEDNYLEERAEDAIEDRDWET